MKTDDSSLAVPGREMTSPLASKPTTKWNTKNLSWRLGADAVSASCAGALIAPIISIIDRSIMENASGRNTLGDSIRSSLRTLLFRPQSLLLSRPCALVFLLYSGTYMTANSVDTASSTVAGRPASAITAGPLKFAASSGANVGLCVYKDQVFARMFGPPGALVPRPVTLPSYALFTLRDCLTIFASFNVPPLLAPYIDARLSQDMRRRISGATAAQFIAPACVQLFSTPIHLLGLDIYNRSNVPWRNRWEAVRSNWFISAAARMGRIIPAFGVGGVVNMKIRRNLMEKLE
ncbi:putative membrane protein [Cladobotryum mycophilum]|uniref:Membrane protein n=1 Tax=Cladobotryum mycophilum TaxID=491253 RepID=A0ABR0S754_9HYPO